MPTPPPTVARSATRAVPPSGRSARGGAGLFRTREAGAAGGAPAGAPQTLDETARTVEAVLATESARVRLYDEERGRWYDEVLVVNPTAVRLQRLNAGAPVLDNHNPEPSRDDVLGSVVPGSARIVDGRLVATLRFSDRPELDGLWNDICRGVLRSLSVGYAIHRVEMDESTDPPEYRLIDWEPMEVSLVAMPADIGAGLRAATLGGGVGRVAGGTGRRAVPTSRPSAATHSNRRSAMPDDGETFQTCPDCQTPGGCRRLGGCVADAERAAAEDPEQQEADAGRALPDDPDAAAVAAAEAAAAVADAAQTAAAMAADAAAAAGPAEEDPAVRGRAAVLQATQAERARVAGLQQVMVQARAAGCDLGEAFRTRHLQGGTRLADIRADALRSMAERSAQTSVRSVRAGGQDEATTRRDAIIGAILHRHDPRAFPLNDAARQYRGLTLVEMAREVLTAQGVRTRGLARHQVVDEALRRRSMNTTSDFPYILADVVNRTLRRSYDTAPRTFTPFCRQVTATDFRPINRVQLGGAPKLEKVNEKGEYKRGTLQESKETYALATYGKVVSITRHVLINDDLDAFTRVPALFGQSISNLESDTVWNLIINNVVMGDGKALFHADHANLAAAGAAIAIDSVAAGRAAMARQTDLDATTVLNLRPNYLLVPTALELAAAQLTVQITPNQTTQAVPEFIRSLIPIAEPRLDAASSTGWYLAANPSQIDTIEYAYLEGEEGAYVETRMGFDVDGVEVKCRLDFGAGVIDHRGFHRNPGA